MKNIVLGLKYPFPDVMIVVKAISFMLKVPGSAAKEVMKSLSKKFPWVELERVKL